LVASLLLIFNVFLTNCGDSSKANIHKPFAPHAAIKPDTTEKIITIPSKELDISLAKKGLGKQYIVFIKRQNYSSENSEKFIRLLARLDYLSGNEIVKGDEYVKQIKKEAWSKMREFVGENRYPDFIQFYNSMSERATVEGLDEILSCDNKLDDKTKEKLITTMYHERERLESPGGELSPENIDSKHISFQEMTKIQSEKYLECAKGLLSKTQYNTFEKQLKTSVDEFQPKIQ